MLAGEGEPVEEEGDISIAALTDESKMFFLVELLSVLMVPILYHFIIARSNDKLVEDGVEKSDEVSTSEKYRVDDERDEFGDTDQESDEDLRTESFKRVYKDEESIASIEREGPSYSKNVKKDEVKEVFTPKKVHKQLLIRILKDEVSVLTSLIEKDSLVGCEAYQVQKTMRRFYAYRLFALSDSAVKSLIIVIEKLKLESKSVSLQVAL